MIRSEMKAKLVLAIVMLLVGILVGIGAGYLVAEENTAALVAKELAALSDVEQSLHQFRAMHLAWPTDVEYYLDASPTLNLEAVDADGVRYYSRIPGRAYKLQFSGETITVRLVEKSDPGPY